MLQQDSPPLTREVWNGVFAQIYCEPQENILRQRAYREGLQHLLNLRLVCKFFDELHREHVHRLVLHQNFRARAISSLLAWMRRGKIKIACVRALCANAPLYAVLGALEVLQAPLIVVELSEGSHPALEMLSAFDSIQVLSLRLAGGACDLACLQKLPHLVNLSLFYGSFSNLEKLEHLTRLSLAYTKAYSSQTCKFVSALQRLDMAGSELTGLHGQALSSLRLLWFVNSRLGDMHYNLQLSLDPLINSFSTACLTHLTRLQLSGTKLCLNDVQWLTDLTSLKVLSLGFSSCKVGALDTAMHLTNVTNLAFTGSDRLGVGSTLCMDCDWRHLHVLQELSVRHCVIQAVSSSAASLMQLEHLTKVSFNDISTAIPQSFAVVAALLQQLVLSKPEVRLITNWEHLRDNN